MFVCFFLYKEDKIDNRDLIVRLHFHNCIKVWVNYFYFRFGLKSVGFGSAATHITCHGYTCGTLIRVPPLIF